MENKFKILNPNNIIYTKQYFRERIYYVLIIVSFTEMAQNSFDYLKDKKNSIIRKKRGKSGKPSKRWRSS